MEKPHTDSAKSSAMSIVFVAFIVIAIISAAFFGKMKEINDVTFESAKNAVTLAIGLIGIMALWLGLVRVLEAGGLMHSIAKGISPLLSRLFPDVPRNHPAFSAIVLNFSANILGLGNAATPFGIKAMVELNRLNPFPGTATNAMCLFLAVNTSSITILPLGVVSVRAAAGAAKPFAIFVPTLLATLCSTVTAIIVALYLAKRDRRYTASAKEAELPKQSEGQDNVGYNEQSGEYESILSELKGSTWRLAKPFVVIVCAFFVAAFVYRAMGSANQVDFFLNEFFSYWFMPALILAIILFGVARGVKVYEAVTNGAKQGFDLAVRIIPFLVAILVAIGMVRASGAMDLFVELLAPITNLIFMPAEALPMALIRPLSGSGAFAIMSAIVQQAPDSYQAFVVSVMMGSTETTFYVMAVYFGAVGVSKIRHALVAGLAADVVGIIAACLLSRVFYTI